MVILPGIYNLPLFKTARHSSGDLWSGNEEAIVLFFDEELLKKLPMKGSDDIDDFNVVGIANLLLRANFGVALGRVKLDSV